ncbi:MAG TPA: GtrA family protein [Candidatus Limosilactobacillus merdigallinarum]|uniref:GtrA family protein n=1 Tax=Candidatus Limosilactobacillus merdigallinarum TaxID=2838652 RepID=A0A9D1VJ35_9LACO|nr:GtrA family protein [Candidatus Limosilactobacillus merdigallinarum]
MVVELIKKLWQKYKSIIAYLFWGVVTTIINIGSYQIMSPVWHWNYEVSTVIAWFLSVLAAYFTNKVWVFGSHYTTVKAFVVEITSFFFYRGLTLLIDMAFMWVGVSVLGLRSSLQQFIVKTLDNVVVIIANYIFSKWLIFKNNENIASK